MADEKKCKECKSVTVFVNNKEVFNFDCSIARNYVNLSWDNYAQHFSASQFDQHTEAKVTGELELTFRFRGTWELAEGNTEVDWPIRLAFASAEEFEYVRDCLSNIPPRPADPDRPIYLPSLQARPVE